MCWYVGINAARVTNADLTSKAGEIEASPNTGNKSQDETNQFSKLYTKISRIDIYTIVTSCWFTWLPVLTYLIAFYFKLHYQYKIHCKFRIILICLTYPSLSFQILKNLQLQAKFTLENFETNVTTRKWHLDWPVEVVIVSPSSSSKMSSTSSTSATGPAKDTVNSFKSYLWKIHNIYLVGLGVCWFLTSCYHITTGTYIWKDSVLNPAETLLQHHD